jgi:Cysteine-rich CPCC
MTDKYPCPCCGHVVFGEPPGSYDICPICFWEDDNLQLRWPSWAGGANRPSLIESQRTYRQEGAMEFRFTGMVRGAAADEPVEPGWRPIDPSIDVFEPTGVSEAPWPDDLTVLYWWRPTFWRRSKQAKASSDFADTP